MFQEGALSPGTTKMDQKPDPSLACVQIWKNGDLDIHIFTWATYHHEHLCICTDFDNLPHSKNSHTHEVHQNVNATIVSLYSLCNFLEQQAYRVREQVGKWTSRHCSKGLTCDRLPFISHTKSCPKQQFHQKQWNGNLLHMSDTGLSIRIFISWTALLPMWIFGTKHWAKQFSY
jgi:hypothetical protein